MRQVRREDDNGPFTWFDRKLPLIQVVALHDIRLHGACQVCWKHGWHPQTKLTTILRHLNIQTTAKHTIDMSMLSGAVTNTMVINP